MKIFVETSVIVSPLVKDEFADTTLKFFECALMMGAKLLINGIVLSELYTWVFLSRNPKQSEKELKEFLNINQIKIIMEMNEKIFKRAGELHAKYRKRGGKRERILADFLIGAHAEEISDILVTWNPSDFSQLRIKIMTPEDFIHRFSSEII